MSAPNLLRWVNVVVLSAAMFVVQACASEQANPQQAIATTWHSGFTLPDLLAEPHPARTNDDIGKMLSKPWYGEILVVKRDGSGEPMALSSCGQYFATPIGEFEPVRPTEGAPYMALAMMCRAAKTIATSKPSLKSHFSTQFIDANLPRFLPPEVAMVVSTEESKRYLADPENRTWGDINRIEKAQVLDPERAKFTHEQGSQLIELAARGDFNGDGLEDVLLVSRDHADGGTYSAVRLFQVTRRTPKGRYELLKKYRY